MDDILQEKFYRRTLILGGLQGGLFLGLIGHLYNLQILKKDHYKKLSDQNRIHRFVILPERGLIVDHKETILAQSKNTYIGYFDRTKINDIHHLIEKLKNLIHLDETTEKWIYKQIKTKSKIEPIIIKEILSYEEVCKIEYFLSELEGVHTDLIKSREYINAEPFSHLIGYVAVPTQQEKNKNNPLFMSPGFKTGKTGLECYFNDHLTGIAGSKKVEVNAYRSVVRTLEQEHSISGKNLHLNINAALQTKIYDLLMQHQSGACMVMDIQTGAIRAFVSAPGYDTNLFIGKISHEHWHDLSTNPYRPLINKLTSGLYAPGSVFKMITALAALEKNIIHPNDRIHCSGYHDVNGHIFHCWTWKHGGHGYVNMSEALASSCDIYFYKLAHKLKINDITDMAKRFGFGIPTGVEIAHEKSGFLPSAEWKRKKYGTRWGLGDTINVTIGQGALLCTPLQLCRMMAAFVNGGKLVQPRLVSTTPEHITDINIKPEFLSILQNGMFAAINSSIGTAFTSRTQNNNFQIAGKTSTTQVVRITADQRRKRITHNSKWDLREHAFFSGYGPTIHPRYATVVFVEHGAYGSKSAAPIGRDALLLAKEHIG